ncbi:hypothetical protein [Variovorax boronicumulans]|uniref:hypothetical protein n=1 Tax=Variovorax boronicumulans TaxID=436515 RepID=UPI0012E4C61D|nr:hypothetical protein [Variovorax boronicumulans]GER17234.1 hypothetical protein VCH24_22470 [Variovorax boronicumulans]
MITRRTGKKGGGIPAISTRAPRRRLARIARGFATGRVLASITGARAVAPPMRHAPHICLIVSDPGNLFFLQV